MKIKIEGNKFAFPTPIFIVSTYNEDGTPNAMNAAWAGVGVSNPPCITVSIQKTRKTYENIMNLNEFVVNIPSKEFIIEADYFGLSTGFKTNKFDDTGLNAVKAQNVNAPYIEEFPINIECKVINVTEIGSHFIIIGEVNGAQANEECFNESGKVDFENSAQIVFDPINLAYHEVGKNIGKSFSIGKEFINK